MPPCLAESGILQASEEEKRALSENSLLVSTFSSSFNAVRGEVIADGNANLDRGIYQVVMLPAPFLREAEREHLRVLAARYLR